MIDTPQNMWLSCQKIFRSNVNEQQYQTWFSPMRFKSFDAEKKELLVGIPSQFFYEYLEEHFRRLLRLAINRVFGNGEDIDLVYEIEVVESATVKIESNAPQYSSSTQNKEEGINKSPQLAQAVGQPHDLDSQLNPSQNFKNFIEGASNKLPRSIGETIARNPEQQAFNPLFIYGHSGVGKTHLVNAIGTQIKELHPEKRVLYLSAHLFEIQFTDSRKNNTFSDFIHFYQSIDVLIMDDVQELIGKVKTQYAFFHIFNHLKQIGKQIILTSDRPPTALEGMEDRLITRFKSGLLAELEQPEEKLRRDILASKIKHDGLNIPEDVVDFISRNVSDSVRELEGVIHRLLAYSVVYNKDVDLNFAQQIITNAKAKPRKEITLDHIVKEVANHYSIRQEDVYGRSRQAGIVLVRQLSMYLAQEHTSLTNSKIGLLIGNRNHATVIHSVKTIENRIQVDKELRKNLDELEDKLRNNL